MAAAGRRIADADDGGEVTRRTSISVGGMASSIASLTVVRMGLGTSQVIGGAMAMAVGHWPYHRRAIAMVEQHCDHLLHQRCRTLALPNLFLKHKSRIVLSGLLQKKIEK